MMTDIDWPALLVKTGDRTLRFPPRLVTVGRSGTCDVDIADERVAPQHLTIEWRGGWWFADVSDRGVWHGGRAVRGGSVEDGIVLRLGHPEGPPVRLSSGHLATQSPIGEGPTLGLDAGRELVAMARRRPIAVALAVLGTAVVAWFTHVAVIAGRYDGSGDPVAPFELVPGPGNRLWGYVVVVLWVFPLALLLALVLLGGPRRAGRILAEAGRSLTVAAAALGVTGQALGLAATAVAALVWAALSALFTAGDPLNDTPLLSTGYAALLTAWALLFATGVVGSGVARRTGRLLGRVSPRLRSEPRAVGAVALAGLAAGFALHVAFRSDALVVLLGLLLLAGAVLRGRAVTRLATLLALLVVMPVLSGGAAHADDGGWSECGATLTGYLGCEGTGGVYLDGGHALPSGVMGGALGAAAASALLARQGQRRQALPPGVITVVPRLAHEASSLTLDEFGPPAVAVGLRPNRDPGVQNLEALP